MIQLINIGLNFGERKLLQGISFMLNKKDKVGLVGKNGAGKSTLFKIMTQQLSADEGMVEYPKHFTLGYLKQDLHFDGYNTVMDEVKTCFIEINHLEREIEQINTELTERSDYESQGYLDLIEQLADINNRLALLSPGSLDAQCESILKGLGFTNDDFIKTVSAFSGGWQMRIELAKLLLTRPDLLLLDEPTNHLDIDSIIWLEEYLRDYPGIVLVISHDKQFLDNVCNKIFELEFSRITQYTGNYSKFIIEKEQNRDILLNAYANQQKVIAEKERTINRFMAKATKTTMAQSMQKQLDKIERIEVPEFDNKAFKVSFKSRVRTGRIVIESKGLSKSFGTKEVLKNVDFIIEKGEKIAFVGQNGMGKTTMAKMLVGHLAKDTGDIKYGANVVLGYYAQNQAELIDTNKTVLQVMEDNATQETNTQIRSVLGAFLFSGEDVDKKVSVLSGGERARLAMACMVLKPSNLIIMDEPTNHLDIQSKEVLKQALIDYDGTLIIVSHDREFLQGLCDKVYEFTNKNIVEHLGDINYFLEKKKMGNIRDIDTQTSDKATDRPNQEIKFDFEEQKKAKRRIQILERDIEKLEAEIAVITEKMMDSSFYTSPDFDKANQDYMTKKAKLDNITSEWEEMVEKWA
jgi:ATP-binding cassette subfamily F protein 3